MGIIIDFVTNIGLDIIKNQINDSIEKKQAENRLTDYLSRQRKLNYDITKDEEIDFEALANYIKTKLIDDITDLFIAKGSERGDIRKKIINNSIQYANAHTSLSSKRVQKIVSSSIDILAKFYRKKVNRELLFVTSEIEEVIISENQKTRNHISNKIEKIYNSLNSLEKNNEERGFLSIDQSIKQIQNGNIVQLQNNLKSTLDIIEKSHALYPDYGFGLTDDNKLVSKPLTENAPIQFPQNIKIKSSSIRLGQQKFSALDNNILNQAYRHQQPLYVNVEAAKQYLGTKEDPIQNIAEKIQGKWIVLKPQEFPPAFSCYVTVENNIIVPYLLLRTKEILDDDTIIVTNEEQKNFPCIIRIEIFPYNCRANYMITMTSDNNNDQLKCFKFLKQIYHGDFFSLKICETNQILVSGKIDKIDIEYLDQKIAFLESIIKIEKYFNIKITIPTKISAEDHNVIEHLCSLIDGSISGHWTRFECKLTISDQLKHKINNLGNQSSRMTHISFMTFNLFGNEIKIPIVFSFEPAIIDNYEKTISKILLCDNGDDVNVVFVPLNQKGNFTELIYKGDIEKLQVAVD